MNLQGVRHVGREVILPYKRRSGEVSEIEGLYLKRANMPIFQALLASLYR